MSKTNGTISSRIEQVTPQKAEHWLSKLAPNQRHLSRLHVERLTQDFAAGEWRENGESIKFDASGHLIDGQHRLRALLEAGATASMLVVRGLHPEAIGTIDTGRARKLADVLSMKGYVNCHVLASTVRWWYWYDKYRNVRTPSSIHPTHQVLQHHMEARAELNLPERIRELGTASIGRDAIKLVAPSILTFVYSGAYLVAPEMAQQWVYEIGTGQDLSVDSPSLRYRNRVIANKLSNRKLEAIEIAALAIKSWNAYISGEVISNLRWRHTGPSPEEFPQFVGLERESSAQA